MPDSPVSPQFQAVAEEIDGHLCVRFAGELDLATAPEAQEAVSRARRDHPGPLRLDLSGLTFLDSTGLRLVAELHTACRADGCALSIAPGPRSVQRVFEVAGVSEILPFQDDPR